MQERYHALDSMRATMMLLGIYLHVVVGYSGNGHWPYIDAHPTPVLDWSLGLIHGFRMPAFFAMAGFFGGLLWEKRGRAEFTRNRFHRVVLPFAIFWSLMFPGIYPFTRTWHPLHLWFLEYLAILYVVGGLVASLPRQSWVQPAFRWALRQPYAPAIFAVFSWPALLAMRGTLKDCDGFLPEPLILAAYVVPFGFGWLLWGARDLLSRFRRHIPVYLVAAFAGFVIYGTTSPRSEAPLKAAGNVLMCWCLIFALLGLFLRFASKPSGRWRYVSDASYWMYIMHAPVVIGWQLAFTRVPLSAFAKIWIVLPLSVAVLLLTYYWFVRTTAIGALLNGRRYPRGLPVIPTASATPMPQTASAD